MLQFQLVGWSHYGFTNDKGQYIEGYKFHVIRPSSRQNFNGNEVAQLSVSERTVQQCGDPQLGVTYNVVYDQTGKLASYKPAQVPGQTQIKGT